MPASNFIDFIDFLYSTMYRVGVDESAAKAYYSFHPYANQANFEFAFNDLTGYNSSFLKSVSGIQILSKGSGNVNGIYPIIFESYDGGNGASGNAYIGYGTGILQDDLIDYVKFTDNIYYSNNLIPDSGFSNTGSWLHSSAFWSTPLFVSGRLHLENISSAPELYIIPTGTNFFGGIEGFYGPRDLVIEIDVIDALQVNTGDFYSYYGQEYTGQLFDGLSQSYAYIGNFAGNSPSMSFHIDIMTTGKKKFATSLSATDFFSPVLYFGCSNTCLFSLDNFNFYTGEYSTGLLSSSTITRNELNLYGDFPKYTSGISGYGLDFRKVEQSNTLGYISGAEFLLIKPYLETYSGENGCIRIFTESLSGKTYTDYSLSFWANFDKIKSGAYAPVTLMEFGNNKISLVNNGRLEFSVTGTIFGVPSNYSVLSNTTVPTGEWIFVTTSVNQESPLWTTGQGLLKPRENASRRLKIGFNDEIPAEALFEKPKIRPYFTPDIYLYPQYDYCGLRIDQVSFWKKQLSTADRSGIYNNPYTYPFSFVTDSAGQLTGVSLTASGSGYVLEPKAYISGISGGASVQALMSINTGIPYADSLVGFSVGSTNLCISGMQNGYINLTGQNDFLRIGNKFESENWTAFINLKQLARTTGYSQVILSTSSGANQQSGLILGLTDSNRLFCEWNNTISFEKECRILDKELFNFTLMGVSVNSLDKSLNLTIHEPMEDLTTGVSLFLDGYENSSLMFLGGFPNSTNNTNYTGFYGEIHDFLLLGEFLTQEQKHEISKTFFSSGVDIRDFVEEVEYYPIISQISLSTGVIGSGITGSGMVSVVIPDKDGSDINAFAFSDLTGEIVGPSVNYIISSESGVRVNLIPNNFSGYFYDTTYILQYAEKDLVFLNHKVDNDILQIYSYTQKTGHGIGIIAEPYGIDSYYLQTVPNIDYSGYTMNFYENGIYQVYSTGYVTGSGLIWTYDYSDLTAEADRGIYDFMSGSAYTSGWTGYSGRFTFRDTINTQVTASGRREVYLNGQKLISGYDYVITGASAPRWVTLTGSKDSQVVLWPSGFLMFAPQKTGNRMQYTGSGILYHLDLTTTSISYLQNEMIWLNGIRMQEGYDYKKISPISLLKTDNREETLTIPIYTGDLVSESILSTVPNI